jgi:hypothetical protein
MRGYATPQSSIAPPIKRFLLALNICMDVIESPESVKRATTLLSDLHVFE